MSSKGINDDDVERLALLYPRRSIAKAYLSAAKLAKIPAGKPTRAFIAYAHWQVRSFGSATRDDGLSRQLNVAIREIETASNRLLRALKYLETREGKELISYNFHTLTHRDPKIKWSESQFISYLANVHQTTLKRAIKNDWLFANAPLDDFKRRLEALKHVAERASIRRLPKQKENRTKAFIKNILLAVDRFGGNLTYDKNNHTGSLAQIYEFFRAMMPADTWTELSPATLQRLKSACYGAGA